MEPKQNYLLVGIFVLLFVAGLFSFVVWLSGSGDKHSYSFYKTYFTDSVTGLSNGASVKYRGVEVGKVSDIAIVTQDTIRIQITMRIMENTPITQGTVAVLKMLGITGLAYVELEGGSKDSPALSAMDDEIPIIASRPSEFSQLVSSVPEILDRASNLLQQLSRLINDDNAQHISVTLANIEKFSDAFGGSGADVQKILRETAKATEQMNKLLERANQFSDNGFQETSALLLEMRNTLREIHDLAADIRENPSKVIIPNKAGGVKIP